jgi:hypothetical protein
VLARLGRHLFSPPNAIDDVATAFDADNFTNRRLPRVCCEHCGYLVKLGSDRAKRKVEQQARACHMRQEIYAAAQGLPLLQLAMPGSHAGAARSGFTRQQALALPVASRP